MWLIQQTFSPIFKVWESKIKGQLSLGSSELTSWCTMAVLTKSSYGGGEREPSGVSFVRMLIKFLQALFTFMIPLSPKTHHIEDWFQHMNSDRTQTFSLQHSPPTVSQSPYITPLLITIFSKQVFSAYSCSPIFAYLWSISSEPGNLQFLCIYCFFLSGMPFHLSTWL